MPAALLILLGLAAATSAAERPLPPHCVGVCARPTAVLPPPVVPPAAAQVSCPISCPITRAWQLQAVPAAGRGSAPGRMLDVAVSVGPAEDRVDNALRFDAAGRPVILAAGAVAARAYAADLTGEHALRRVILRAGLALAHAGTEAPTIEPPPRYTVRLGAGRDVGSAAVGIALARIGPAPGELFDGLDAGTRDTGSLLDMQAALPLPGGASLRLNLRALLGRVADMPRVTPADDDTPRASLRPPSRLLHMRVEVPLGAASPG
jgi:hypothetical protein